GSKPSLNLYITMCRSTLPGFAAGSLAAGCSPLLELLIVIAIVNHTRPNRHNRLPARIGRKLPAGVVKLWLTVGACACGPQSTVDRAEKATAHRPAFGALTACHPVGGLRPSGARGIAS